jgi:hypothetical protein
MDGLVIQNMYMNTLLVTIFDRLIFSKSEVKTNSDNLLSKYS